MRPASSVFPGAAFPMQRWVGLGGVTIRGFGATTGVASLLMFCGDEPPSLSLGFAREACRGGGGGGGGWNLVISMIWSTLCGSGMFMRPDKCRKANSSAAWIATTAATAPPLSRLLRSDRYITGQRHYASGVAAA